MNVVRTAIGGVVEGVFWDAVDGDVNRTVRNAVWGAVNDRMIDVRGAIFGNTDYIVSGVVQILMIDNWLENNQG